MRLEISQLWGKGISASYIYKLNTITARLTEYELLNITDFIENWYTFSSKILDARWKIILKI